MGQTSQDVMNIANFAPLLNAVELANYTDPEMDKEYIQALVRGSAKGSAQGIESFTQYADPTTRKVESFPEISKLLQEQVRDDSKSMNIYDVETLGAMDRQLAAEPAHVRAMRRLLAAETTGVAGYIL